MLEKTKEVMPTVSFLRNTRVLSNNVILFGFHYQKNKRKQECGGNGASSHHLVDLPSNQIQLQLVQSCRNQITYGWNRVQEDNKVDYFAFGSCLQYLHADSSFFAEFGDKEDEQHQRFSKKHRSGLSQSFILACRDGRSIYITQPRRPSACSRTQRLYAMSNTNGVEFSRNNHGKNDSFFEFQF